MNIASILSASSPKLPFTSSQPYLFCALYRGRGELARVGMSHSCIFCVTGRSIDQVRQQRANPVGSVRHSQVQQGPTPKSDQFTMAERARDRARRIHHRSLHPKPSHTLRFVGFLLLLRQISRMRLKQYWASETVASQSSGILSDTAPKAFWSF